MDFVILQSFNNYMDAHLLMARLESEDIECWLQDENTVTVYPIWNKCRWWNKIACQKRRSFLCARQIFWEVENNRKQAN